MTQLIASLFTFALTAAAARALSIHDFGLFSLAFAIFSLVQGCIKGLLTEPIIYSYQTAKRETAIPSVYASTGVTLALGATFSIVGLLLLSSVGDGQWVSWLLIAMPALVTAGHLRYMAQLMEREWVALIAECVALSVLITGMFVVEMTSLTHVAVLWSSSVCVSAIIGLVGLRLLNPLRLFTGWSQGYFKNGLLYVGDFMATNSLTHGSVLIVGAIGGPTMAGAIRAAQILLTPLLVVTRGLMSALGPAMNRVSARGDMTRVRRISVGYSAAAVSGAVVTVLLVFVVDLAFSAPLLGESTDGAMAVFPFAVLSTCALGIAGGAALGLRAVSWIRQAFILKLVTLPIGLIALFLGAIVAGAPGAQAGLASSEGVRAILNWRMLSRSPAGGRAIEG
ncbi:hypothetical protein AB0K08_15530 [Citricoccus sp. NPDC055426]|uniref:hypothetical protein n=1 Tax=Citricoccus sp. NPDC055426 TaxID=3155536 RepID=UPI00342C131D